MIEAKGKFFLMFYNLIKEFNPDALKRVQKKLTLGLEEV